MEKILLTLLDTPTASKADIFADPSFKALRGSILGSASKIVFVLVDR